MPAPAPRRSPTKPGATGGRAEATNKRLEAQLHGRLAAAEKSIAATRSGAWAMSARSRAKPLPRSSSADRRRPGAQEVAAAVGDVSKR